MMWAEREDLTLKLKLDDEGAFQLTLFADDAVLNTGEARRLAAALLNAADQIDDLVTT